MPATVEQVTQDALTLSEQERARLAQTLLLSLDAAEGSADVEAAWDAEIARRLESIKDGTDTGRPAEQVFREIRERYH